MNCPSEKKFNWTLFKLKWTVACSWCRVGYGSCLGCHVLQCALCYTVRIALGPYARRTVVRQNSAHTMSHNNWSLQVQHALSRPKCNAPEKCGIKFNVCSVEYSCLIVMLLGNQWSKALRLSDSFENRNRWTGHCATNPAAHSVWQLRFLSVQST